jgi:hypothetical protein
MAPTTLTPLIGCSFCSTIQPFTNHTINSLLVTWLVPLIFQYNGLLLLVNSYTTQFLELVLHLDKHFTITINYLYLLAIFWKWSTTKCKESKWLVNNTYFTNM